MATSQTGGDDFYVRITRGDDASLEAFGDQTQFKADPSVSQAHIDATFAQKVRWCFGPLCIDVSVDISVPSFTVTITLLGIQIAKIVIDPKNPRACIDASVKIASVKLCVEFSGGCLSVSGELCLPFVGCKGFKHQLFCV